MKAKIVFLGSSEPVNNKSRENFTPIPMEDYNIYNSFASSLL